MPCIDSDWWRHMNTCKQGKPLLPCAPDQTPEGSRYPSAIRALAAAGRPFGMLGAGHTGRCNPEGANYKVSLHSVSPPTPEQTHARPAVTGTDGSPQERHAVDVSATSIACKAYMP